MIVNEECENELITAVAHEIKNPVALAMANVSLIRLADEAHQFNGHCTMIERALMNINDLVLQLIDVVDDTPDAAVFSVNDLLDRIIDENRTAWPHIIFTFKKPPQPLIFKGEHKKIQMIFTNLLKNAVEAVGASGFIDVVMESARLYNERSTPVMKITIRDSGKGIDDNVRAHIASGRYTSKPNGSGMGLFICQTIVTRCGGQLQMNNSVLGGCEAIVTLPLCS